MELEKGIRREGKDEEDETTWVEINEAIDTMKDKKAAGIHEMPNEVWKYIWRERNERMGMDNV